MNFKENHESIELLLKDKEYWNEKKQKKQSFMKGVYIFSKFRDSKYRKIGLAAGEGGIFQRLKYYTICFPHEDEFFIDFIITTKTRKEPRKLEELFHKDRRLESLDNKKASKEYKKILTDKNVMTDVRDTDDKKITSALEFNNIVKDILENNRGVWEYVIAFGNDGVVVRNNKQELGDIVTAYQQPRGNLTPLKKHNIEGLFKERDRSLFVWEKEGNKIYKVGDKIKVEGEGEAVIERLEKDGEGKTNACIRFPKDTECVVVKDFYRDIKYSADEKKSDEDANDDGVLKENDVVAILASEKNRKKDGRSFYLGKILKIRRVKDYSTEFIEIQDYHSQKEDTVYTLAFGQKKGKGVGPPITGIIGRDNVLTKVKSVKGLKGKLSKDELKRIRKLV